MDEELLEALRALADLARVRIAGRLAERPMTVDDLAASLALPKATVAHHLERLAGAGLVTATSRGPSPSYVLRPDRLARVARALAAQAADPAGAAATAPEVALDAGDVSGEDAAVLRSFIRGGRLVSIPAQDRKRQVVLRFLCGELFGEDRPYTEREVNERLAAYNEDFAALRRYMVDAGLMTRSAGEYRRVGA